MIRPAGFPTSPRFQPQKWAEFYAGIQTWSYNGEFNGDAFSGTFNNLTVVSSETTGPINELQILKFRDTSASIPSGALITVSPFMSVRYYIDTEGRYVPSVGVSITQSTNGVTTTPTAELAVEFSGSILGQDMGSFYSLSDGSESGFIVIRGEQWWEYRHADGSGPLYNQNDGTPV